MCSARSDVGVADDRTAKARIRDAAITQFAENGIAATNVRAIAVAAGVSPSLVIHHFGTMDALRHACDEHIVSLIRVGKRRAMTAGAELNLQDALRSARYDVPLTRYLARSLADGSPQVADLIDEMVSDADQYMAEGVDSGTLRASEHPRERAVVVTLWSLGVLVLHEHLERLLGVDLTRDPSDLAEVGAAGGGYFGAVQEIFSEGLFSSDATEQMRGTRPEPEQRTDR